MQVARDLFYWHGIRATGIDKVAAEAGVAPTTLYRRFASKDDLVAAYVEREGLQFQEWFTAAVDVPDLPPRKRILAVFDALDEQVQPHVCRGCPFLIALAEFPDSSMPAHRHAVETKAWVRSRFRDLTDELAETTPVDDPAALADQLTLVVEGVYASTQALGAAGPARQARALAEMLLDAERR
jgi:AcrR family transcriptional regulator